MLIKNKASFTKIFFKTFMGFSLIFLVGNISANALFYFFPSIFRIFSSWYSTQMSYNELRISHWSWDIESLESSLILGREADRTELLGDSLYTRGWDQRAIIDYYERSLALREISRVRMKLAQVSSLSWISRSWSWEDTPEKPLTNPIGSGSTPEIENATMRIQESAENRGKYIQKPYDTYVIQDSRDFLEFWIERKDW